MSIKIEEAKKYCGHFLIVIIIATPVIYYLSNQYKSNKDLYINNLLVKLKEKENNIENFRRENISLKEKYKICFNELIYSKKMNNSNAKIDEIEKNIMNLQNKFSSLGIDLNSPNWCDKNYTKRFYEASAILSSIKTQASRYKELEKYNAFVFENQAFISVGKGVCKPKIHKNIRSFSLPDS